MSIVLGSLRVGFCVDSEGVAQEVRVNLALTEFDVGS